MLIGGSIADVVRAGRAATELNREHGFAVAPTAIATASGVSPGLGLSARF